MQDHSPSPDPKSSIADQFLSQYESEQTRRAYRTDLKKLVDFLGGERAGPGPPTGGMRTALEQIRAASEADILAFLRREADRVSEKTVRRRAGTLRAFFEWVLKEGILQQSPLPEADSADALARKAMGTGTDEKAGKAPSGTPEEADARENSTPRPSGDPSSEDQLERDAPIPDWIVSSAGQPPGEDLTRNDYTIQVRTRSLPGALRAGVESSARSARREAVQGHPWNVKEMGTNINRPPKITKIRVRAAPIRILAMVDMRVDPDGSSSIFDFCSMPQATFEYLALRGWTFHPNLIDWTYNGKRRGGDSDWLAQRREEEEDKQADAADLAETFGLSRSKLSVFPRQTWRLPRRPGINRPRLDASETQAVFQSVAIEVAAALVEGFGIGTEEEVNLFRKGQDTFEPDLQWFRP